ncbi:hypothetical protein HZS_5106 [Henneguya salminicola]|nr:hypothetical protein HZS_5106 [Henneguya salminicola]
MRLKVHCELDENTFFFNTMWMHSRIVTTPSKPKPDDGSVPTENTSMKTLYISIIVIACLISLIGICLLIYIKFVHR